MRAWLVRAFTKDEGVQPASQMPPRASLLSDWDVQDT